MGITATSARQAILAKSLYNGGGFKEKTARFLYTPIIAGLLKYKDFVESKIDVWNKQTFTIKISTGCRGNCSYCSIKNSRGHILSKKFDFILEEFKTGLEKGYSSFAFIGTDIGDYGKDREDDLVNLLTIVVQMPDKFHLRLRNINPRWIVSSGDGFHDILKTGKIRYIESPIQSASNRILQLMKRGYKAEDFMNAIHKIKSICPSVFIKNQIIVGFPGDPDEDFRSSIDLCDSRIFD